MATIIAQPNLNESPITTNCPNCHSRITTQTNHVAGLLTYLAAGGIACFGCILGCCLIPFFVDVVKDVEHSCPNCNYTIGKYKRI